MQEKNWHEKKKIGTADLKKTHNLRNPSYMQLNRNPRAEIVNWTANIVKHQITSKILECICGSSCHFNFAIFLNHSWNYTDIFREFEKSHSSNKFAKKQYHIPLKRIIMNVVYLTPQRWLFLHDWQSFLKSDTGWKWKQCLVSKHEWNWKPVLNCK